MQNLSIQGKNSKSCKKLPRNQNGFGSCQRQESPAQSGATAPSVSRALCCPHSTCAPRLSTGVFWGVKINQTLCKEKPYLYLIRPSQAQQVWAKRVIMIWNKPEIYLWPTLKKKKSKTEQKQNQNQALCVLTHVFSQLQGWGGVHNHISISKVISHFWQLWKLLQHFLHMDFQQAMVVPQ